MFKRKKVNPIEVKPSALDIVKKNLTTEFRNIRIKSVELIPDLSDIILYSRSYVIKAKLENNESNTIHIKLENVEGFVFEWFTENYDWFLDTFLI